MVGLRPYDADRLIRSETQTRNSISKSVSQQPIVEETASSHGFPEADLLLFPMFSEDGSETTSDNVYPNIPPAPSLDDPYAPPPENAPPLLDDDFLSYEFDVASLLSTSASSRPMISSLTSTTAASGPMISHSAPSITTLLPQDHQEVKAESPVRFDDIPAKAGYSSPSKSYQGNMCMPTPDPLTPLPLYQPQATTASPLVTSHDAEFISPCPSNLDSGPASSSSSSASVQGNVIDDETESPLDPASSLNRIAIQRTTVAPSRSSNGSEATAALRRAKNTMAARRSRARKADKVAELQRENESLAMRLCMLSYENEKLQSLVAELRLQLRHR